MAKKLKRMTANEIARMEQVAKRILAVPRCSYPKVAGLTLKAECLNHFPYIIDWLQFHCPQIVPTLNEIKADIEKVADSCSKGEPCPRSDWLYEPCGYTLSRCAERLRDMATKTKDEREDEKPVRISVAEKSVKVSVSAIKQAVGRGEITSYRKEGTKKNSPHLVLVSEVVEYFSEHGEK